MGHTGASSAYERTSHKVTLSQVSAGDFKVDGHDTSVYVDTVGNLHFGCHELDQWAAKKLKRLLNKEL